jgi:hypothetical protein
LPRFVKTVCNLGYRLLKVKNNGFTVIEDEKDVMIIARKVEVVPFRDEWTSMFAEEAEKLKRVLGRHLSFFFFAKNVDNQGKIFIL